MITASDPSDIGLRPGKPATAPFHILSVGWGARLVGQLLDPIEQQAVCKFSHIFLTGSELRQLRGRTGAQRLYSIRDDGDVRMAEPDPELLASLEDPGVPTIHNMIMGDHVVRGLRSREALSYATHLARRLGELYDQIQPSAVIGGFDALHGGIALAVAKRRGIPWFALHASTIPMGLCCFCTGMTPNTSVIMKPPSTAALRTLAETTLTHFEEQIAVVPAFLSANNTSMIVQRLPRHLRELGRKAQLVATGRFDRFAEHSLWHVCKQYVRKRKNLFTLPTAWMRQERPATPYLFLGLHMQPESSIDVWAPFFSDQLKVVESVARSIPPSHQLLVKIHRSDADNYSRRELDRFRRIPGVQLVSPFAQARSFIEGASAIVAIQGTIGLEGALLGKPVVLFGESRLAQMPSVSRVEALTELPAMIRSKLSEPPPDREAILRGFMSFLSPFTPGMYNDWESVPSAEEVRNMAGMFALLRDYVAEHGNGPSMARTEPAISTEPARGSALT